MRLSSKVQLIKFDCLNKGGIEGPAGPANAVPLSEAVCNAGVIADLFRRAKVPAEQIR